MQSGEKLRVRAMVSGNSDPATAIRFVVDHPTAVIQEKRIADGTVTFDVKLRVRERTIIPVRCEAEDGSTGLGTITVEPARVDRRALIRERVASYQRRRAADVVVTPRADDDEADDDDGFRAPVDDDVFRSLAL